MALLFALNVFISNFYGAGVYGDFLIWIMILNIAGMIAVLGLDTSALQQFPSLLKQKDQSRLLRLFSQHSKLLFIAIFIAAVLFSILQNVFPSYFETANGFYLLALIIGPFVVYKYVLECLRASENIKTYGLLAFVVLPGLALSFCFLFYYFSIFNVLLAYGLALFIVAIFVLLIWRKQAKAWTSFTQIPNKQESSLSTIVKGSSAFMFIAILMFLNEWVDKFMLRSMYTNVEVGWYGAAFRLIQLSAVPLLSINAIVAPKIARSFSEGNHQQLKLLVNQSTLLTWILSIPVLLLLFLFPELLLTLFGSDFVIAKTALFILLFGQIANNLVGPVGIVLKMSNMQHLLLKIIAVSVILNIALNMVLIPRYDIDGAAIATSLSMIFVNTIAYIFIKTRLGFFTTDIQNALRKI